MIKIINQKVSIEAMYLDSDIEYHLLAKLKRIMKDKCTADDGYFININKITCIGDNTIENANSLVICDVIYEAEVLKPTKGQILSGKVCMVFQHGIFVDIYGKMKVLVPSTSMNNYTYNESDNNFTSPLLLEKTIENGVDIDINIVDIKYEKKQFSCIGKL